MSEPQAAGFKPKKSVALSGVAAGNTAVVVEHNLDVMAEADWILDLGPEAGEGGGRIVAQGAPAQIARRRKHSHTGRVLEDFLRQRTRPAVPQR